jgi:hypothetical protein
MIPGVRLLVRNETKLRKGAAVYQSPVLSHYVPGRADYGTKEPML